jgi:hypothetical protein
MCRQWPLIFSSVSILLSTILFSTGCKDNSTEAQTNRERTITTLVLIMDHNLLTPLHETRTRWRDLDGPGGNPPTIDTLRFHPGRMYEGSVLLLDEITSPVDTISLSVRQEAHLHQFEYTFGGATSSPLVTMSTTDLDVNSRPVGLEYSINVDSTITIGAAGTLRVLMKQFETAQAKSNGGPFTTKLDITFPVIVR